MKIAIGNDHAGYELKDALKLYLIQKGNEVVDYGTNGPDSVDYPDFAHAAAKAVESKQVDFGILICGSANGMTISANKHAGIRCALCWRPDIAALAKQHNNANMIALPARYISVNEGIAITNAYMEAQFEGGRHQNRVNKIHC